MRFVRDFQQLYFRLLSAYLRFKKKMYFIKKKKKSKTQRKKKLTACVVHYFILSNHFIVQKTLQSREKTNLILIQHVVKGNLLRSFPIRLHIFLSLNSSKLDWHKSQYWINIISLILGAGARFICLNQVISLLLPLAFKPVFFFSAGKRITDPSTQEAKEALII